VKTYTTTLYDNPGQLVFGSSLKPLTCGLDVVIGGGDVLPEVNFTLPEMHVREDAFDDVKLVYHDMVSSVLKRMVELKAPGVVVEIEHPPQFTQYPEIGVEVTSLAKKLMTEAHDAHGLKSALRITPCDVRDIKRPPAMRTGAATQLVLDAFRLNARAGADLLSIESTGGKEVSDKALTEGNVPGLLLALGVLAPRDMHFLWHAINEICEEEGCIPAGDTACAFGNTAMVLADQGFVPNVLAAVVRAMSAVRSLVAFEEGAVGPSKDCAYEGPVIKAITGYPISMEGKSAACAHFSHVGNVASACCDLWSNESVQQVKLLSGFAPEVFAEILLYDCRLMNEATLAGAGPLMRDLAVKSDVGGSVHALVITPESSFRIAQAIVAESGDYNRTRAAGLEACRIIREGAGSFGLDIPDREMRWLDRIESDLDEYATESALIDETMPDFGDAFLPAEYGM
jgi:methanol--5-hydroxybenzimidazolylcobamide Co-methyltransferase